MIDSHPSVQPIASQILTQSNRYKTAESNLLAEEKVFQHGIQVVVLYTFIVETNLCMGDRKAKIRNDTCPVRSHQNVLGFYISVGYSRFSLIPNIAHECYFHFEKLRSVILI